MSDDLHKSRTPLLVFSDDWERHPSSCQHLVRRLRHDFRTVWVNSIGTRRIRPNLFTIRRGLEKIGNWAKGVQSSTEGMWVIDVPMLPAVSGTWSQAINPYLVKARLSRVLNRLAADEPIVLTTLPYVGQLASRLPKRALVYYCTDDYSFWPGADRAALQRAERELCRNADLVIAASQALVERLSATGPCHYLPHGVDYQHFAAAQNVDVLPPELARIPGPRIGFFGLIYEKLDFDLLTCVADSFPTASLVMIGPIAHCPPAFRRLSNVYFTGQRAYEELPQWLAGLDVLLMPYIDRDEMIRQSNPLKLRECLATGKPTVSVDVPEARLLQPHVKIAADREQFVKHVRESLAGPRKPECRTLQQAAVEGDDWNHRALQLASLLSRLDNGARVSSQAWR